MLLGFGQVAQGETANHAGGDPHATFGVGTYALQARLGADDRGRSAVGHRCAHRQGDRIGNGRRGQHLFDGEGLAKLRIGVVHRVIVVLGAHRGDLALGGAVGLHVPTAHGRVDGHELAVRPIGLGARRKDDALPHPH
ncbi:hypothetical protein D3C80_1412140 [compost metagenome]